MGSDCVMDTVEVRWEQKTAGELALFITKVTDTGYSTLRFSSGVPWWDTEISVKSALSPSITLPHDIGQLVLEASRSFISALDNEPSTEIHVLKEVLGVERARVDHVIDRGLREPHR